MLRDKEEVFRFIWENRRALRIDERGYVEVLQYGPAQGFVQDGFFVLRETVAEYVQILTLTVEELKQALAIEPPQEMPHWKRIRIYGGGALIFDEYGQLNVRSPISLRTPSARRSGCTICGAQDSSMRQLTTSHASGVCAWNEPQAGGRKLAAAPKSLTMGFRITWGSATAFC